VTYRFPTAAHQMIRMMRWSSLAVMLLATFLLCCFVTTASAFSPSRSFSSSCSRNKNHHHPTTSFFLAGAATATAVSIDTTAQRQEPSAFETLARKAIHTLLKSDSDTDENEHAYGSASQGLWINSQSAKEMQNVLDRVVLQVSCV
jgi:hypothetical protein